MRARKPTNSRPDPILVLDLGSASVRAALIVDGRPQVLTFPAEGGRIPTIVGFDTSRVHQPKDQLVLGDVARRLAITEPRTQVFGALRLAGRRHELAELDDDRWRQVAVERGPGGDVHFRLAGEAWPVPRVLGALAQSIIEQVQRAHDLVIERAVVSIAPGSSDARRRALVHALRVAGLEQVELVHGTTAAALAWATLEREGAAALGIRGLETALMGRAGPSLVAGRDDDDANEADEKADDESDESDDENDANSGEANADEPGDADEADDADDGSSEADETREQTVLLLDLGASSFDAALARLDDGNVEIFASRSRADLGGDDIDERIVNWLLGQFEDANEVDLSGDATVRARMRDVAEKAKRALSDDEQHQIRLPFVWADASGPKHLFVTLERSRFERLIHDLVEATAALAQALLEDAGQDPDELDAVVLVGGSARVPVIQDRIEALLGRVPETELATAALDDDFVVRGLALEAHRRNQRRPQTRVVDIASRELWLTLGGTTRRLIDRGTPTPVVRSIPLVEFDEEGRALLELHEADDDERALALRVLVDGYSGSRKQAKLHIELDAAGCIGLRVDHPSLSLTLSERVGLSPRALARLRLEARTRAKLAAARDRSDRLRQRVAKLAKINEAWLANLNAGVDDLLRTSLVTWGKDTEAALEQGDEELLPLALEAFAGLIEALPTKLRAQLDDDAVAIEPSESGDEASEDEAAEADEFADLDDGEDDYGSNDRVAPLELRRADEPEPDEVEDDELAEVENADSTEATADADADATEETTADDAATEATEATEADVDAEDPTAETDADALEPDDTASETGADADEPVPDDTAAVADADADEPVPDDIAAEADADADADDTAAETDADAPEPDDTAAETDADADEPDDTAADADADEPEPDDIAAEADAVADEPDDIAADADADEPDDTAAETDVDASEPDDTAAETDADALEPEPDDTAADADEPDDIAAEADADAPEPEPEPDDAEPEAEADDATPSTHEVEAEADGSDDSNPGANEAENEAEANDSNPDDDAAEVDADELDTDIAASEAGAGDADADVSTKEPEPAAIDSEPDASDPAAIDSEPDASELEPESAAIDSEPDASDPAPEPAASDLDPESAAIDSEP
ncbi:Hsp70 family protein, partial [Enhygromyxa salina]|uniref:Hsp70 family protein n=1 Tax=Enhygromyxa salina TaxID=215803 RepID=UPI001293C479